MTWDPDGPMYDEPKPRRKKRVRPPGRHPLSDDADSDASSCDDYVYGWPSAALTDQVNDLNRKVGSGPLTAAGAPSWTMVGKPNPQPVRLSQQGIEGILQSLHDVVLQPSSGRGKSGKELCLGLSYTNHAPYAHPKTSHNQEFIQLIVEEVRSHKELHDLPFTTIQILHDTICAPTQMTASMVRCLSP